MSQEEEIEQLASQMDWGDAGVESGDDEGPQEGQGAFVAGVWLDALDPHPSLQDKGLHCRILIQITFRVQLG